MQKGVFPQKTANNPKNHTEVSIKTHTHAVSTDLSCSMVSKVTWKLNSLRGERFGVAFEWILPHHSLESTIHVQNPITVF